MTINAVFFNEQDKAARPTLREKRPNGRAFILTGDLAFVAPEGIAMTVEMADAIGIGQEGEVLGIVFEWAAHKGRKRNAFWGG